MYHQTHLRKCRLTLVHYDSASHPHTMPRSRLMIQLVPAQFALESLTLESNNNTLNQFKCLAGICRFASFHSNIVDLNMSLVLHLSGLNVLTACQCFEGKILTRTRTSINATEIISACLLAMISAYLLFLGSCDNSGHEFAALLLSICHDCVLQKYPTKIAQLLCGEVCAVPSTAYRDGGSPGCF